MTTIGYPDWQQIQQWIGSPVAAVQGAAIGAGAIVEGPFNLSSWASVILSVKPTGGPVTVTVSQAIRGAPSSLTVQEQFVIPAGGAVFDSVVLFGDAVTVTLQGSIAGTTVDYAVTPSNTTTNAQVLANATINVQLADALVAAEPTIDFLAGLGLKITAADDPTNTRVKLTIAQAAIADVLLAAPAATIDVQNIPQTFAHLEVRNFLRDTGAFLGSSYNVRFNADIAADYASHDAENNAGAIAAGATGLVTSMRSVYCSGATAPVGVYGSTLMQLVNYTAPNGKRPGIIGHSGVSWNTTPADTLLSVFSALWQPQAINRVQLTATSVAFDVGSRMTIEGKPGA